MSTPPLFEGELHDAMQQLYDETIEAMQLAKVSPDLDDLSAVYAVALLKLGMATGFVEHLKLPHYVDFQAELVMVREMRREASKAEAAE